MILDLERIQLEYKTLFPKHIKDLENYGEWVSWQAWQKSVNNERKPHIVDFKISLTHSKVSIHCELYYDMKESVKETMIPRTSHIGKGSMGKGIEWTKEVHYRMGTVTTSCRDYYTDEFILSNDSLTRLFSLVEFLLRSGSLIKSSEYQKIRSIAYKILKKAKSKVVVKKQTKSKEAVCYMMKDTLSGLYKIGMSVNPKHRERTLQSEKPSIKMVKVFDKNIEKELHESYKRQRVRGEWFELNKVQVRYICTHY